MVSRDDVLDVALQLFADQGYAATTTAQIERALGLRAGSGGLFRHVSSKQELLRAAIERAMQRRHDPPPGPFDSPAHALVAAVLHLVDADPALWRLVLREGRGMPVDIEDFYARLVQPAFDQAVDWVRRTIGDTPDPAARVVVVISALLYLRTSQFVYGRTPAGLGEEEFLTVARQLLEGSPR